MLGLLNEPALASYPGSAGRALSQTYTAEGEAPERRLSSISESSTPGTSDSLMQGLGAGSQAMMPR